MMALPYDCVRIDFPLGLFALIFGSIFIGLSFIFGNVLREIFEAILLIFAGKEMF